MFGLDGCLLKGYYEGQVQTSMVQYGNNGFYPVEFVIVNKETKDIHGHGFLLSC